MWKCKHCGIDFEFTKTADKANHSRWCDCNPKVLAYRHNPKLSDAACLSNDTKYGPKKEFGVMCAKCGNPFTVIEREKKFPAKAQYFCSRSCSNSRVVSVSHRKKTSESITGKPYITPYTVTKTCECCNSEFTALVIGAKQVKNGCSRVCNNKLSSKKRHSESRKKRSELVNYRADCAFKFNLRDYPDEFDFSIIDRYGWYSAKNRGNNSDGVSRDHMISVRYGFDNCIPTEIISHPANCRLIQQRDNVAKYTKCSLTLDELLGRIAVWDTKYPEFVRK